MSAMHASQPSVDTSDISSCKLPDERSYSAMTASCFAALISSQLVIDLQPTSRISSNNLDNTKLACILAILGKEYREGVPLPCYLRILSLRNIFFLIGNLSTAGGTALADVLDIAEQTLIILAECFQTFRRWIVPDSLPEDQRRLFEQIHSIVMKAGCRYRLKDQTVETDELQQLLNKLLSMVAQSQDPAMQIPRRRS
jgi:hypothetical protein